MNHKVTVWAVCTALAATITGCSCCQADEGTGTNTTTASAGTAAAPTVQQPKKAVTPDGEVMWIVAEWDACCTPCPGKPCKTCKTAKCWQTKDGKVLCVKPLKNCPKAGKKCPAAEHYKCKSANKVMCTQDDPAKCQTSGSHCYAAKEVTPCPVNGAAACSAREHVNLPEGKKGCAKADAKEAKAPAPDSALIPLLDTGYESDAVFEISSAD